MPVSHSAVVSTNYTVRKQRQLQGAQSVVVARYNDGANDCNDDGCKESQTRNQRILLQDSCVVHLSIRSCHSTGYYWVHSNKSGMCSMRIEFHQNPINTLCVLLLQFSQRSITNRMVVCCTVDQHARNTTMMVHGNAVSFTRVGFTYIRSLKWGQQFLQRTLLLQLGDRPKNPISSSILPINLHSWKWIIPILSH